MVVLVHNLCGMLSTRGNMYLNAAPFHTFQFVVNKNGNNTLNVHKVIIININNNKTHHRINTSVSSGHLYRIAATHISRRTLLNCVNRLTHTVTIIRCVWMSLVYISTRCECVRCIHLYTQCIPASVAMVATAAAATTPASASLLVTTMYVAQQLFFCGM